AITKLINILTQSTQAHSSAILMVNRQRDIVQEFCTHVLHLQQSQLMVNQPAAQVDWENLAATLTAAENQELEEWTTNY
ncbi:MAG: methionine ABC transporter ATP-binding protein, partial [Dolichospermum sp.]